MDYDLVMLRITYSGLSDWAFKELMRAPFWKRGYVQFLDFEHNLEIFDEMFEVFNHEDTKDEDAPKPNLLKELYPYYENLKYLCLNWTRVSDDAMKALFSGPLVKNLVHLEMDGTYWNNTEEDSSIILFEKTNFTCLRYFTARHSNLMD